MICVIFLTGLVGFSYGTGTSSIDTQAKIRFNGRSVALSDVYGPVYLSPKYFNPGRYIEESIAAQRTPVISDGNLNIKYINDICGPSQYFFRDSSILIDTPSHVASKIISSYSTQLIEIVGSIGSGKSVALKKISHDVRTSKPTTWTVIVHLQKIYSEDGQHKIITMDDIMENCVPEREVEFFKNVFKINPQRVHIFFDGLDKIPPSQMDNFLMIISEFNNRGTTLILAGRTGVSNLLKRHNLISEPIVYEIAPLKKAEIKMYLMKYWIFELQVTDRRQEVLVTDFVNAVNEMIEHTPLPRTFAMMRTIGHLLTSRSTGIFDGNGVSISRYLFDEVTRIRPMDLLSSLNQVKLHKIVLYDQFFKFVSTSRLESAVQVYGPLALNFIIKSQTALSELTIPLLMAHKTLSKPQYSFDLIHLEAGKPTAFIHPEFERYFASKYLLNTLVSRTPSAEMLKIIFQNSEHAHILEFIDTEIKNIIQHKQVKKNLMQIVDSSDNYRLVMDNLIKNGFDNLCSFFSEFDTTTFTSYIQRNVRLESDINYSLGMLTETNSVDIINLSPRALILNMNMPNTALKIQHVAFGPDEDWPRIIRVAVTNPRLNFQVYQAVMNHIPQKKLSTNFLNQLLYLSVNIVGNGCQLVAKDLVLRGAEPHRVKDGKRTLIHAAAKWGSASLLRFVFEELHVYVRNFNRNDNTILFTILDANPFPRASPTSWWDAITILLHRKSLIAPKLSTIQESTSLKISKEDISSPFFSLLTGGIRNPVTAETNLLSMDDESMQEALSLARIVTPEMSGLTRTSLNLRRISVLRDCLNQIPEKSLAQRLKETISAPKEHITVTEILIRYRGVDPLAPSDEESYQRAIKLALEFEPKSLSPSSKIRILTALYNNIGNFKDLSFFMSVLDTFGDNVDYSNEHWLYKMIQNRVFNGYETIPDSPPSWAEAVLQPRTALYPTPLIIQMNSQERILYSGYIKLIFPQFSQDFHNNNNNLMTDTNRELVSCLAHRSRRSINCHGLREDVDIINDGQSTSLKNIRLNSDRFLPLLTSMEFFSNPLRVQQLINFAKMLHNSKTPIITGNFQLVTEQIIESGSLSGYYNKKRSIDIVNYVSQLSQKNTFLPKIPASVKKGIGYGAHVLMFIRAFQGTLMTCLQEETATKTDCIIASTALTVNVILGPLSYFATVATNYALKIIKEVSETALQVLSSITSKTLIDTLRLYQKWGIAITGDMIGKSIKFAGFLTVGFDVWNIIRPFDVNSQCLADVNCHRLVKNMHIISITFSCLSIAFAGYIFISSVGFIAGALIGVALIVVEMIAQAINNVVYYHNAYETSFDEEFRLFWHNIVMAGPPSDVEALVNRTNTIRNLENEIWMILENSANVVAYGVGIGDPGADKPVASEGWINMNKPRWRYTNNLSRVIPNERENTTRLCLPQLDQSNIYDKFTKSVSTATYECHNTFVIAHSQRWRNPSASGYIIYDLQNINRGKIIGNGIHNNLFLLSQSQNEGIIIEGGHGKIINIYMLRSPHYKGVIKLGKNSKQEILDFSLVSEALIIQFIWNHKFNFGSVILSYNTDVRFQSSDHFQSINLHIIGRSNQPDIIKCQSDQYQASQTTITADGGGGESEMNMDILIGCRVSKLRPFTEIISPAGTNTTFMTELSVGCATSSIGLVGYINIKPQQSRYVVSLKHRPLLSSIYNLQYIPINKTLIWELQYIDLSVIVLSVLPYHASLDPVIEEIDMASVTCIFIDDYFNATIYPVIKNSENATDTIMDVRVFNIFAEVQKRENTQLVNIIDHYHNMMTMVDEKWSVVMRLTNSNHHAFLFGSNTADQFYIDAHTKFIFGGNGPDTFTLTSESPKNIWIENEADDDALDTLIIVDGVCSSLSVQSGSMKMFGFDESMVDVTLNCLSKSASIKVIFKNYYLHKRYQHLQIQWCGANYQLWSDQQFEDSRSISLVQFISLDKTMQIIPVTKLTSNNTNVIFNITGTLSPLIAYRSESHDLILTEGNRDLLNSLYVTLINFFSNEENNTVSSQWRKNKIYIRSDNPIGGTVLQKYDIEKIMSLLSYTEAFYDKQEESDDFYEYLINMTVFDQRDPFELIQINSSDNDAISSEQQKLGIIKVVGGQPRQFNASFNDSCMLKLCISATDYCHLFQRTIYRIEFLLLSKYQLVAIHPILDCANQHNNNSLNDKLIYAQKQLETIIIFDESDKSQLMRCVSSLYADKVSGNFMHRLFGFQTIFEYLVFIHVSCEKLFKRKEILSLSQNTVHNMLNKIIKMYDMNEEGYIRRESISQLQQGLVKFNAHHWSELLVSLYRRS